jgi:signal transduction histidine kinase/CheY-like chemotaxis protein
MEFSSAERSDGDPAARPLRALVAGYPGAAVHLWGKAIWFNSFAEDLIGYEASELTDVDAWFAAVFGGSEPTAREVYHTSRRASFPQPDVLAITHKDGAERVVEFSGYTGVGEEVWFMRDLTEAHRSEQALRNREQRLQVTVDVARLGTWEWEVETGRMAGDETARRLFGLSDEPQEATYEAYLGRVHSDDRPRLEDAIGVAIETRQPFDVEFRVRRDETRWRWLHVRGTVAEGDDSPSLRVIGAIQDIDDHKRLDQRLIHAARMESLGQLAGGIAHDFNNLLVVIQGHLEFVKAEPELSVSATKRLDSIASAVGKGADMVSSLMQLGRSKSETANTVDINAWFNAGRDTLRQLVGENVTVEFQLDAAAPFVRFDDAHLAAVALNLATNARDAMPGGGTLHITTRNVSPHNDTVTDAELPGIELVFADTGTGMDRATRERIFEPFFTTKPPGVGTGLGLASAYEAIIDAGGEIGVASTPGQGSTFTIHLPSVAPDAEAPANDPIQIERSDRDELIMVAEDDAEVLELAADILRSAGYRVLEALGPHEALEYVAAGEKPDLLLSDAVMPDLSGPRLAARLVEQLPDLPVLYMSGYASEGSAGVTIDDDDLIRKPFSHLHLLERVAQRLPRREQ